MKREGFFYGGSLRRQSFLIPGAHFYEYDKKSNTDMPEENSNLRVYVPTPRGMKNKQYIKQTTEFMNYVFGFDPMVVFLKQFSLADI